MIAVVVPTLDPLDKLTSRHDVSGAGVSELSVPSGAGFPGHFDPRFSRHSNLLARVIERTFQHAFTRLSAQALFHLEILTGSQDPERILDNESSRFAGLSRTLVLLADLLQGRPHDRRTAATRLRIGEAAAFRQLTAIEEALPAMTWNRKARPWQLQFDRTLLSDPPDEGSAVAACFGLSLAPLFDGASQEDGMRRAFSYVLGQSRRRKIFRDIERKFMFVRRGGESALPDRSAILDRLIETVLHSQEVAITYRHFDGAVEEIAVQPLSLCISDHQLYLVGRRTPNRRRLFRLSRLEDLRVTGSVFEYPATTEYDPQQLFADSLGVFVGEEHPVVDAAVKLSARWATHARTHRWHASQQVEALASGEVIVRLRVRHCPELQSWVLSFGDNAEVLEPESLKTEVAHILVRAAQRYSPVIT
jgi:predicted DNA-binding transcriptional regulator YafY